LRICLKDYIKATLILSPIGSFLLIVFNKEKIKTLWFDVQEGSKK